MVNSLPVRDYSISACDSAKILEVYGVLHYTSNICMLLCWADCIFPLVISLVMFT